jgi:hypothetical protein
MASDKKNGEGYIVCYKIDPNDTPGTRGYVIVDPNAGQYYYGPVDNPDQWTPLGQSPTPDGKSFPKNQPFTFAVCSHDNTMELAWVVTYAPRPVADYSGKNVSPFKDVMLRNADGELARAGVRPDKKGDYHYTLTTDTMKNGGRFLFSMYATIVAGNGAGKAYAVDPEMEVSEI